MKLTISKKLALGFFIMIVLVALTGGLALWDSKHGGETLEKISQEEFALFAVSRQIEVQMLEHRRFEKDLFLNIGKPKKQKKYLSRLEKVAQAMEKNFVKLQDILKKHNDLNASIRNQAAALAGFHGK